MRRAFTLVEIAFSLLLVAIGVITLFMVLPSGVRVQNQVRYRALAAAKALELADMMRGAAPGVAVNARDLDKEGVFPWDTRITYKAMAPDMESSMASLRGTVFPLPEAIARRIDSDRDEIAQLLDSGAQLFYFSPKPPIQTQESSNTFVSDDSWMSHGRRIVVAVVGAPQQNSILYHPSVKVGAYQDFYPTPPTHGVENPQQVANSDGAYLGYNDPLCYDALCRDPLIAEVFKSSPDATFTYPDPAQLPAIVPRECAFGYLPFATDVGPEEPQLPEPDTDPKYIRCKRGALGYTVAALWYAEQVGLTRAQLLAETPASAAGFADAQVDPIDTTAFASCWRRVLAMRYLAHAATCLTRYHTQPQLAAGVPLGGDPLISMNMKGVEYQGVNVTLDAIRAWHEISVRMAVMYADQAGPYHWGAGRPLNRQVMMDHPLLELDLWSDPISGTFDFHTPGDFPPYVVADKVTRRQWRGCYPQDIVEPGLPFMFPGRQRDTNDDGCVDPRDPAGTSPWDYPARILDTDRNGRLDEQDRPVPTTAVSAAAATPVLGSADWVAHAQDMQNNGQAALGPASNFTLTAPFTPDQRCRELVFWAVDWQAWEDFESQPSAVIDGGRYPVAAPMATRSQSWMNAWNADFVGRADITRQLNAQRRTQVTMNSNRNPELADCFRLPTTRAGVPFEGTVFTVGEINEFGPVYENHFYNGQLPDLRVMGSHPNQADAFLGHDTDLWNMMVYLGKYGVNRDGRVVRNDRTNDDAIAPVSYDRTGVTVPEGVLDRGRLPAAERLRASSVCRFVFYDQRASGAPFN
ncbi:MAG: hypothetical protein H0W72_00375 [Planctomycetes bacterium]|nr:hypothetical protein [Planctomycetota bacterium]